MKQTSRTAFNQTYHVVPIRAAKVKLRAPTRIGGWVQGFVNGRTGTAALEDGAVHSAYIESFAAGYRSYTAKKRGLLLATVTSCCADLRELLHSYSLTLQPDVFNAPDSAEAIRAAQRREVKQQSILRDMIQLTALLEQSVRRYNCEIKAAAYKVSRGLACYCKGVLFRKPVHPGYLPTLEIDCCEMARDYPEECRFLQSVDTFIQSTGFAMRDFAEKEAAV